MIIGFTGHRDKITDPAELMAIHKLYPNAVWVHGGAKDGFDKQVNDFALSVGKIRGTTLIVIRPNYGKYPPNIAPLIRNKEIVNMADLLICCYDGRKKGGTFQTRNYADGKIPIKEVACNDLAQAETI